MSGKIIVCRCEDVSLDDLRHAVGKGYSDIEEVKRYTGFGTGPCQGKECLRVIALALAQITGKPPASIPPFTARPPLTPTPLKIFARDPSGRDPVLDGEGSDGSDGHGSDGSDGSDGGGH